MLQRYQTAVIQIGYIFNLPGLVIHLRLYLMFPFGTPEAKYWTP